MLNVSSTKPVGSCFIPTAEERRKIVNKQMDIIEKDNKFAPMDDSDGCDTEDDPTADE